MTFSLEKEHQSLKAEVHSKTEMLLANLKKKEKEFLSLSNDHDDLMEKTRKMRESAEKERSEVVELRNRLHELEKTEKKYKDLTDDTAPLTWEQDEELQVRDKMPNIVLRNALLHRSRPFFLPTGHVSFGHLGTDRF